MSATPPGGGPPPDSQQPSPQAAQGQPQQPGQPSQQPPGGRPPTAYHAYDGEPPAGQPQNRRLGKGPVIGISVGVLLLLAVIAVLLTGRGDPNAADIPIGPGAERPQEPDAGAPTAEPSPSGTLEPSPVATNEPPAPPPPPEDQTTPPLPLPIDQEPAAGTDTLELGGEVSVPLAPPWRGELIDDGSQAQFGDGQGNSMWMALFTAEPSTTASALIAENLDGLIGADNFTGLQIGDVQPVQPFGSIVSFSNVPYQGVFSDPQGSLEILGLLWVAVRSDGRVFAMTTEATPPAAFDASLFAPVAVPALDGFAGTQ